MSVRTDGPPPAAAESPLTVAVFANRETPAQLARTLEALLAIDSPPVQVDLMCNGRLSLANAIASHLQARSRPFGRHLVRVWHIETGDKANAWNQHLHRVWDGRGTVFYLDGHCRVDGPSLRSLEAALSGPPGILGASAVPSAGRTAIARREEMLRQGGLVGEFLALPERTLLEMRRRSIRLPMGLYGFDALLGAMLAFGLDPARHDWQLRDRVAVCADSTWSTDTKRWWSPGDLGAQASRHLRIALRKLVCAAMQAHLDLERRPPEALPLTCREFVERWAREHPEGLRALLGRYPLARLALWRLRRDRDWSPARTEPRLVLDTAGRSAPDPLGAAWDLSCRLGA